MTGQANLIIAELTVLAQRGAFWEPRFVPSTAQAAIDLIAAQQREIERLHSAAELMSSVINRGRPK